MNYYERIQKSIEYIENNLENKIDISIAAREAFMSTSNFYRLFFALVGHSVKEYIRKRRISLATNDLINDKVYIIDIAVKYDFDSADAFSRAFKRITGFIPSEFKKQSIDYSFERVNILERYFDIQDKELLEKYPDIKVLKQLEPMKVAYYCYYGKNPEHNAFEVIKSWLYKNSLSINQQNLRIFGYNNPSPASEHQQEYGYEVCVTIDDTVFVNDDKVKVKTLEGGLYAVAGVKHSNENEMGIEIMNTWTRFNNWLLESKYIYGGHQWLEEHLGFDDNSNHIGSIDLYMPITEKDKAFNTNKTFMNVEPMLTASYTAFGKDAAENARELFLKWADKNNFIGTDNHRFFAYYNQEKIGTNDFFYKIHVTVEKDFKPDNPEIKLNIFPGGYYAVMNSKYKYNGFCWTDFINWIKKSNEYKFADYWFFEEYKFTTPQLDMETDMILYMPVKSIL